MSNNTCPIAYDHTDDLDECMVCGWRLEFGKLEEDTHQDPTKITVFQLARESIAGLSGVYAPVQRILFDCRK